MNANILKSKMKLFSDTNITLASAIGLSAQRLSAKINETNGAEFTQREIQIIMSRYELTSEEVNQIFFA